MAGKYTLQILDGHLKSSAVPLRKEFVFDGAAFQDLQMNKKHAKLSLDHNLNWKINGLDGNKIRIGSEEMDSISLIPGLIFHLGQTGFKVIERRLPEAQDWELMSAEFIDNLDLQQTPSTDVFFFLFPVQIHFLQGPQSGSVYTLGYGPRILGSNHLDLDLKDPALPHELLRFSQIGNKVIIENLAGENVIQVNKNSFTKHTLVSGDRFAFGSYIIEISILK